MNIVNEQATGKNTRHTQAKASGMVLSISTQLWELFRLNMLFLICCIPVVTAPGAASALSKTLLDSLRGREGNKFFEDFRTQIKTGFLKSLLSGLVMISFGMVIGFIGFAVMRFGGFMGAFGIAWLIVFGLLWYFGLCYLFPLIALVDITWAQCVRNALLLSVIEFKRNLLLLFPLALLICSALLFPFTLPLMLILFAVCQYLVCIVVNKTIQKRIIDTYINRKTQHGGE